MPSLPSVDGMKPKPEAKKQTSREAPVSEGYIPRLVDVRMTLKQATILRDKLRALQDVGAKTADGRYVTNRAQAVRWILENEVVI